MTNQYYNREERKVMIVAALAIKAQHEKPPEGTVYQIARLIGMARSKHLENILSEMCAEGRLTARNEGNGRTEKRTVYSLPEGSYELPKPAREVKIRINGQEIQGFLF